MAGIPPSEASEKQRNMWADNNYAWLDDAWDEDVTLEDPTPGDDTQCGQSEGSRPENDLALTLPETLLPSSTVSPNSDSSSTTSLSSGQSVSGVADDAPLLENQGAQYRCQDCDVNFNHKGFKHKKDLDRHLQTAKVHSMLWFQCGCSYTSTRKDNFRTHIERHKIRSDPIRSITCWCGEIKESSSGLDVDAWIQEHMDPCGQRPRGRPKKEK